VYVVKGWHGLFLNAVNGSTTPDFLNGSTTHEESVKGRRLEIVDSLHSFLYAFITSLVKYSLQISADFLRLSVRAASAAAEA